MRVKELAADLKVDAGDLLQFLRKMGVRVGDVDSSLADADVAKILARLERERPDEDDRHRQHQAALCLARRVWPHGSRRVWGRLKICHAVLGAEARQFFA